MAGPRLGASHQRGRAACRGEKGPLSSLPSSPALPHQRLCPLRRRQPDRHVHRERRLSEAAAEGLPQPQSECVPEPRPDARPGIRAPNIGTTRILPLPGEAGLSLACSPPPPPPRSQTQVSGCCAVLQEARMATRGQCRPQHWGTAWIQPKSRDTTDGASGDPSCPEEGKVQREEPVVRTSLKRGGWAGSASGEPDSGLPAWDGRTPTRERGS